MANVIAFNSLATLAVESIFYGIFLALFVGSILIAAQSSRSSSVRSSFNRYIYTSFPFVGGIALFLTITPHWILTTQRTFYGFSHYPQGSDAQLIYLSTTITPTWGATVTLSTLVPTVADVLLIYRLWRLWNHNLYIIVFPVLTIVSGLACGGVAIYKDTYGALLSSDGAMWDTVCYALTLSTNTYCTGLIFWRLWKSGSRSPGAANVTRIMIIFTESAVIYMGMELVCFILSAIQNGAAWVSNEAMVPITGIAFMLINVLVWTGYTAETHEPPRPYSTWSVRVPRRHASAPGVIMSGTMASMSFAEGGVDTQLEGESEPVPM